MDLAHAPSLLLCAWFLLLSLRHQVGALKLLNVSVPSYIKRGDSPRLECRYDLQSDNLYSVSWYKDNEHIYSWSRRTNKKQIFIVEGVKIDAGRSNSQVLQLQSVSLNSSGWYSCEVNSDKPIFKNVRGEAYMEVIEPPKREPKISGVEKIYATGDVLALNCTSGPSFPAARLQWFINDDLVKPESEVAQLTSRGLYVTRSTLRLQLEPSHLSKDKIEIRCISTVKTSASVVQIPYLDTKASMIYVQGHANHSRSSSLLLIVALFIQTLL